MTKKKKETKTTSEKGEKNTRVEKVLVENFVSLQKVMTNLAVKLDKLSDEMSKLLELFEISAKAMAEKDFEQLKTSDNKETLEKLNKLLEQNKIIAKGLTLIGEKNIPFPNFQNIQKQPNEQIKQNQSPMSSQGYQMSKKF